MTPTHRGPRTRSLTLFAGALTGLAVLFGAGLLELPSAVPSAELGQTGTLLAGALVYVVAIVLGVGVVYLVLRP
jgi:hypothetical protein